ncbi:MAG: tRNA epoxyqueuosine(34) reductase QueG [Planctomycetes bacterium]|nr:tRNA epoxyqueuosine(34) reductase QueG [Planctomycetota bacterium]
MSNNDSQQLTQQVLVRCGELGFALAGVAEALPTQYADQYAKWIEEGNHGEMEYLARNLPQRFDPREMVDGAKSIICVADRYSSDATDKGNGDHGKVARYAWGDDYHVVIKKRLHKLADELTSQFPHETFKVCVDTAPVLEREHAQRAGLGAVGKHTLLIEQGVGSYLLLGEIITTLKLQPTPTEESSDPCGTCTRCIDACPTDAISPWSVDATKCISYLTIEHRSEIDKKFHDKIGDWIFGCDICQEVCPHNQPSQRTSESQTHDAYKPRNTSFDLLSIINWSEQDRRDAFIKSPMKRAKLEMMKRNAQIALNNVRAQSGGGL